jgi:hemolysin activation/secretion protein
VPIFGVHQDRASLPDEDPHAEFHLLKLAASLVDTSLKWVNWRSDLTAQFAFEGLLSDQQLYLSDPAYLRGWNHAIIGADSGFVWRNEFDFHLLSSTGAGQPGLLSLAQWERALTPYVYNDLGYASTPVQDLHHFFGAAGAGLVNPRLMTPIENINFNADILRQLNVAPPETIDQLQQQALKHAVNYGY